ncbi:recombinase family protein [Polaribacter marinus]|uniref:recombinase family protein n=1 Tax=Polaribacter marinus TaxID=2916838 RepID=UPI003B8455DC
MESWKNKNAIIYTRVSTTEQKEFGHSLDMQEDLLYSFCQKNEINIIKHFQDNESAKDFNRPAFKKLLAYSKHNKKSIDLVLCYDWSRFSRDMFLTFKVISNFSEMGIEVNTISQRINYNQSSHLTMLGLYASQPHVNNLDKSKDIKKANNGALRKGRFINRAPIGYYNDKGANSTKIPLIQKDQKKSKLIQEIFEKYATGLYSQESLRKEYSKKGIKRSKSQFSNMLSNITYMGKVYAPEYEELAGEIVNGMHTPIVDEALFTKVQQVKFKKANIRINSRKKSKHEEYLPLRGGVLKCSKCGDNLTGSPSKSRNGNYHYYYHCNTRKGCRERFKVELAHCELDKIFTSIKPTNEVLELFKEILIDVYKSSQNNRTNTVKKLKKEKIQIENKLDNLTEKFVEDSIDRESYNRLKNNYNNQINELVLNIGEYSDYHKDTNIFINFGLQLLSNIDVFYKKSTTEIKRRIIGSIFSEKLVFENKKYRTAKFNDAVALIFNNNKELESSNNEKRHAISNVSYSVAGTGLEPVTFGL